MGQYQDQAYELRPLIEIAVATGDLTVEDREKATTLFPAWSGDGVSYYAGNGWEHKQSLVQFEELLYKCVQDHVSQPTWTPTDAPSLWSRASDPGEEWPEWIQPLGAHDAYKAGDKVSHNEKHWISDVDFNVWEPGISGWTEVV